MVFEKLKQKTKFQEHKLQEKGFSNAIEISQLSLPLKLKKNLCWKKKKSHKVQKKKKTKIEKLSWVCF